MNDVICAFPDMNHWHDKLSWHRARQIAQLVGFDVNEYIPERYRHDGTVISPDDKQFFVGALLDHIFCMMHEWKPFSRWEDLPELVRDWYEKAERLLEEARAKEERMQQADTPELEAAEIEEHWRKERDVMDRR